MSSTIRVPGTGSTDERLRQLEQSNNYGEVVLPFPVVGEVEGGGGSGGPPSGPASGDLSGTYPAPQIAPGAIVDADVNAAAAIQGTKLANAPNGVPTAKLNDGAVTRVKTAPDCWLSPIPVDPADVTKVLTVAAGPTLVWQAPAVVQGVTATWNYRTADGTGDPGLRTMSPDVAAAPTMLRFSKTEVDGTDATNLLVTTGVGDVLLAQQRTDANHWSKAQVRAPIVDHGTWVEVPITLLANSGLGPPADNADVVVQFQRGTGSTSYPPSGPAGGDLDAPGSTYPNPVIGALKVTTGKLADGAVSNAKIASGLDASKLTIGTLPVAQVPNLDAAKITTGTFLQARLPVAPNGLLTANLNDAQVTDAKLAPTTVTAGTYGTAAKVAQITVNAQGRISAVTELDIAPTGGSPSGPAGGDLGAPGSTYPNPTIADGVVTRAKLAPAAKKAYWG